MDDVNRAGDARVDVEVTAGEVVVADVADDVGEEVEVGDVGVEVRSVGDVSRTPTRTAATVTNTMTAVPLRRRRGFTEPP